MGWLDSDVTKFFPDAKSVNEALRTFIRLMHQDDGLMPKTH